MTTEGGAAWCSRCGARYAEALPKHPRLCRLCGGTSPGFKPPRPDAQARVVEARPAAPVRRPRKPRRPPTWTEEQDEILLEAPDLATAAARLGKARRACRTRLQRLEAPPKPPSPRKDHWTAAQDAVLLAAPSLTIAAKLTGRTRGACETRLSRVISVRRGIEASR